MTEESYEWLSLDEDEEVLWSGEPRMKSIIPAVAVGIPFIAAFGFGLIVIAGAYLQVKNTDYVVTSEGVYKKTGIFSRNVQKIGFNKVQNISFSQGFFGTQFDYGNVDISTAGGSGVEMRFKSVPEPKSVQELINENIKKEKTSDTSGKTDGDTLKQILSEIKKTRKAVEEMNEKL